MSSNRPFPTILPTPLPPSRVRSHTPDRKSQYGAQVPFSWRRTSLGHRRPPSWNSQQSSWNGVKLNRQAQGLPGGLRRGPRVLAKV